MAQSKDSRVEKLLLHELQPKEISQVGLVYFATITRWYAKKRQRKRWMGSLKEVKYIAIQHGLKRYCKLHAHE